MDTWWFQGVPPLPVVTKTAFKFFNLPFDIQLHVMTFLDICSLTTFLQASAHAKAIYIHNPNTILKGLLQQWPRQLSQLIQANLFIIQKQTAPAPSPSEIYSRYVDAEKTPRIVIDTIHPLHTLRHFLRLVHEIGRCSRELVNCSLGIICYIENQALDVSIVSSQLSETEWHRIYRAYLRLKLFGLLFFTMNRQIPDKASLKSLQCATRAFFTRLCSWEIEELNSAWSVLGKATMNRNVDRGVYSSIFHSHMRVLTTEKDYCQSETCPLGSSIFCNNVHACIRNIMQPFLPHRRGRFMLNETYGREVSVPASDVSRRWEDSVEANVASWGLSYDLLLRVPHDHPRLNHFYFEYKYIGLPMWDKSTAEKCGLFP
ncbi:hypothetical protein AOQ84DRAFT_383016 [Glonium stellatum]|uniref:F-box domain-containing protein n=1 Tax=Glonium stellatum TaxID=574774 RepID=A0A8E2ENQ6_9PEZI|nr:hypothetical protein AOQ84DRAFT_383016 [Glonium stellatum]